MISLTIFIVITVVAAIYFIKDLATYKSGGSWGHSKKKGEIGFTGIVIFVAYVIFAAIWGGIFWW